MVKTLRGKWHCGKLFASKDYEECCGELVIARKIIKPLSFDTKWLHKHEDLIQEVMMGKKKSKGFMGLGRDYIKPKDSTFQCIPPHIENDSRYMSYFKDCTGCIDGTHIDACIPVTNQMRYRGRKGVPTFNKYYIVDQGYPDRKGYLASYSRVRYHQSQFEYVCFQLMLKRLSTVCIHHFDGSIERPFGVLKKRWKILNKMPKFSETTQIDVIMATFALHNYIRRNDTEDMVFNIVQQHGEYIPTEELDDETSYTHGKVLNGLRRGVAWR
ncbi:hypothetical protein OSB04_002990 [Centaurea solstitialis]|uniref:DDE Tnp4 domain-containing protein n=1 Tax=Centaurea solstitialis TaxID=347529 RepID=A0AA38TVT3_9ASTR|nr:hypothetical protein OSB04_002990 [Centaurea solstitialis]